MKRIRIPVRHPDWITCRSFITARGTCGAMNPLSENMPVRCVRCGRAM